MVGIILGASVVGFLEVGIALGLQVGTAVGGRGEGRNVDVGVAVVGIAVGN